MRVKSTRVRGGLLAIVGGAALVLSGLMPMGAAHAAGPQTVTKVIAVGVPYAGPGPWQDTGLSLPSNASVTVSATGWAGFSNCWNSTCWSDPNGFPSYNVGGLLAPSAPIGSLVGKVGTGAGFFIGAGPTQVTGTGELYLAYNDVPGSYGDDHGWDYVTLTYECYPGNGYGDTNHIHCGPPGH